MFVDICSHSQDCDASKCRRRVFRPATDVPDVSRKLPPTSWRYREYILLGKHTSPTLRSFASLDCGHVSTNSVLRFDWLVWTSARRWRQVAVCNFHLAFLLQSFDVGLQCKINLSACGRCTLNCGIPPPIQYTQIDLGDLGQYTLSVSCSTDRDYRVVFIDRVGVFLEHVHRTLKAS